MNLARILTDGSAAHGDRPALWFEGHAIRTELERRAAVAAGVLRERVSARIASRSGFRTRPPSSPRASGRFVSARSSAPLNILLAAPELEVAAEPARLRPGGASDGGNGGERDRGA